MQLPSLPQIPIGLDQESIHFLKSLEGKVDEILVARKEGDLLSVLGYRGGRLYFSDGYPAVSSYGVKDYVTITRTQSDVSETSFRGPDYKNLRDVVAGILTIGFFIAYFELNARHRQLQRDQEKFHSLAAQMKKQNLQDIEEKIKPIRLYQADQAGVERDVGRTLERVDTGKPETYLHANDTFWLRVEAYQLGADAIVSYQPGSAIGTPVKFKDK